MNNKLIYEKKKYFIRKTTMNTHTLVDLKSLNSNRSTYLINAIHSHGFDGNA